MYLDKAKTMLETHPFIHLENIIPCTEDEVKAIEQRIQHSLPSAYKEFLLWMGHGSGGVLAGSECFYFDLPVIQKEAIELMQEDNFHGSLPDDAFVFFMHQGYQFAYFRLSEGENPPIYYYYESATGGDISIIAPHFSDFLLSKIESFLEVLHEMQRRYTEVAESDPEAAKKIARSIESLLL